MSVHSITELINLAQCEVDLSFPFLESFAREYSEKVIADRKAPLFSRTPKYNNFPVRREWNPKPKRKKETWRQAKMAVTKIHKVSGTRGLAIKVLNKITENNFREQSDELLRVLLENKEQGSVKVIAKLILEKIWYDKSFYEIYANLCQTLWNNNEWTSICYQIEKRGSDFYVKVGEIEKGPYKTKELASKMGIKETNFKNVLLALCRDVFYKRSTFILESRKTEESNIKYKHKRKLFGTVEIMGYFYVLGYIQEDIIHFIILSLLHTDSVHSTGIKYEEEIEALKLLWDVIHTKMDKKLLSEYNTYLKKEMSKKWSSRTKFMIEDMLDFSKKRVIKKVVNTQDCIELSRKNKDIIKYFVDKKVMTEIMSKLIIDAAEYREYIHNHTQTMINLIDKSILTPDILSDSFCDIEIEDLKIDAPRAPHNISILLTNILKRTGSLKIRVKENKEKWDNILLLVDNKNLKII
jgi:hypothetical protein